VTSGVTLVGIKVCSRAGSCPSSAVLGGVLYAADLGLDVINLSLGGGFNRRDAAALGDGFPSFIATVNQVFNYAKNRGVTIVVSAGNEVIDLDHDGNLYKTYCSTSATICVSATGPTSRTSVNGPWFNIDNLASYSNFGRSAISVAAPGGNGNSSVTAACSPFALGNLAICQTGTFVVGSNGTSMASPHVAGLAALLSGEGYNSAQIRAIIQGSADDIGQPGTDPAYGKGRINVARALGL
jgi:subtilisin family serine protease